MSKRISIVLVAVACLIPLSRSDIVEAADEDQILDIQLEGEGMAMVDARLEFPVPPEEVFAVLTDFPNWPDLFPYEVEMQIEKMSDGSVASEMTFPNKIFSWTTRLRIKSRVTRPLRLESTLIEGDFHHYQHVWQLNALQEGNYTHAELKLRLQPKGWIMKLVPEFLYRWLLKGDLEDHFDKLRNQVRVRQGTEIREAN